MPRYFFDTDDGSKHYRDDDGMELPDNEAARREAAVALAGMAKDAISSDGSPRTLTMRVRDEGRTVTEMAVHFVVSSPAN